MTKQQLHVILLFMSSVRIMMAKRMGQAVSDQHLAQTEMEVLSGMLGADDSGESINADHFTHHSSSGLHTCYGGRKVKKICGQLEKDRSSYVKDLNATVRAHISKTELEDLSKFRQRLVNTVLAPQSLLQNALLPHDMDQASLEGFLASWDEVSHLSARDVLALKETWTDADTEMLKKLETGNGTGFVDHGTLTTQSFAQRLPSITDLDELLKKPNWALVGSGNVLKNGGAGSLIDEHDQVVRFNNLIDTALEAPDTGTKTTLHVVNEMVKGKPGVPVFDLEARSPWASYCKRMWHYGDFAKHDGPVFIIRPMARCALSHHFNDLSRGFLFYWFFGRLAQQVDLYGFGGDEHFQSHLPVKDLYKSGHRLWEPYIKYEHLVYNQACQRNCDSAKQPTSLLHRASNLSAPNVGS